MSDANRKVLPEHIDRALLEIASGVEAMGYLSEIAEEVAEVEIVDTNPDHDHATRKVVRLNRSITAISNLCKTRYYRVFDDLRRL